VVLADGFAELVARMIDAEGCLAGSHLQVGWRGVPNPVAHREESAITDRTPDVGTPHLSTTTGPAGGPDGTINRRAGL